MPSKALAVAASTILLAAGTSFAEDASTAGASPNPPAPVATPVPSTTPASGVDAPPAPAPTPAPAKPWVAGYKGGFGLQSETGDFKLKLTGYAQTDGRFAFDDGGAAVSDAFLLRRVRPIVQGTVAQYFDFYLNPDFGGGAVVLQDAYIDVNFTPKLRFRAGKIKTPFGIERLQSGASLFFVERALPNNLVPNRDLGLQVHGELAQGILGYQLAVLNGVADGGSSDGDTNDSKDLAGRIFLQPWKTSYASRLRGLGFGFAATRGTASPSSLASVKSVSQVSVFSYASGATATGDRTRLSPQGYFFLGPLGILAEYVQSKQSVARQDATTKITTTAELVSSAWSVTGSVFLTGEDASYGSAKPKSFFVPSSGTWGAVQLLARVNRIDLDEAAFANGFADPAKAVSRATAWAVGVNWIWNSNLKYVLDYEQTRFQGGAAAGGDRASEKSLQTRLQLSF